MQECNTKQCSTKYVILLKYVLIFYFIFFSIYMIFLNIYIYIHNKYIRISKYTFGATLTRE